ncbi:hypothetical protein BC477_00675 [Clavibacter michiganensis subsp. michiganensis]|uniref:Uncharacterized protein n=1 Tax=Clavibacter michiganensis subsp. michiganensis TaxID=33013 RepID=A0A251XEQ6_CLAMM|nr:hypothetical protein BC477_00675 [Clavibacter michiganensis subsp. michiganensis]OUE00910.1 hypothetical protein CMMCAS07_15840 [Clavibacter michiganensis subsp. michiganensis]
MNTGTPPSRAAARNASYPAMSWITGPLLRTTTTSNLSMSRQAAEGLQIATSKSRPRRADRSMSSSQ